MKADTVFINPEWISSAVYRILADTDIEKTSGRFVKDLLFGKWGKAYNDEEKNKLLSLMQKREFDLIYQVDGKAGAPDTFIAPLLLSDVAPGEATRWERTGSLSFRYRYKFMPKGIITRLIVRLNEWIHRSAQGEELVWKSGVILKKEDAQALVRSDISKEGLSIIDISVKGSAVEAKDFLSHIRLTLEGVHEQSFRGIEVELLVPCTCQACSSRPDPSMFEFSRLKSYVGAKRFTILCEKAFREVPIEDLLGGIVVWRSREERRDLDMVNAFFFQKAPAPLDQIAQLTELVRVAKTAPDPPPAVKEKAGWLKYVAWIVGIMRQRPKGRGRSVDRGTQGLGIEPPKSQTRAPTLFPSPEGNTLKHEKRKRSNGPAGSKAPRTCGTSWHGNREILGPPAC